MSLVADCFDKSFKVLIDSDILPHHITVLDWINQNSKGNVQVRMFNTKQVSNNWVISTDGHTRAFFAFEDIDDALVFRIKYGGNITRR